MGEFVMVRGFGDGPAKLRAVGVRGRAVDVVGADESRPMPFHLERVFRYEPGLFERLLAAHQAGRTEELAALWAGAVPFAGTQPDG